MKKIFKSIACCCFSIAIAIACCFSAMKMSKNQRFLGTSCNKASASTFDNDTRTYYTDNYNIGLISLIMDPTLENGNPITPYNKDEPMAVLLSFAFVYDVGSLRVLANVEYSNNDANYFNSTGGYTLVSSFTFRQSGSVPNVQQLHSLTYFENGNVISRFDTFLSSPNFNSNITRVVFNDYRYYNLNGADNLSYSEYITFTYYDDSSNYLTIFMPFEDLAGYNMAKYVFLGERIYFLNSTSQFDNNDYYNSGYFNGYNEGLSDGRTEGYDNGFNVGQSEGYNNGYTQGLESSDRLGFPALITSVIDVPVKVFTSLFNFEILGVNILTFLTSLLTIALILAIVRKVKSD